MNTVRKEIDALVARAVTSCRDGHYGSAIGYLNEAIGIVYWAENKATLQVAGDLVALMAYLSAQADFIHKLALEAGE